MTYNSNVSDEDTVVYEHKPLEVIKTYDGRYIHISTVKNIFSRLPLNQEACIAKLKFNVLDPLGNPVEDYNILYFQLFSDEFVATVTGDVFYYETLQETKYKRDSFGNMQQIYAPLPINVEQSIIKGWLKYYKPEETSVKKSVKKT